MFELIIGFVAAVDRSACPYRQAIMKRQQKENDL